MPLIWGQVWELPWISMHSIYFSDLGEEEFLYLWEDILQKIQELTRKKNFLQVLNMRSSCSCFKYLVGFKSMEPRCLVSMLCTNCITWAKHQRPRTSVRSKSWYTESIYSCTWHQVSTWWMRAVSITIPKCDSCNWLFYGFHIKTGRKFSFKFVTHLWKNVSDCKHSGNKSHSQPHLVL